MKKLLRSYRTMLLIRRFEQRVETLFSQGRINGTAHPAVGQEAVAVGVCNALHRHDYVTSTHRGHGHFLARGGDPARIMAELFGKQTGYSGGRGGSQLMADARRGFLGANGITGAGIPLATGVALSCRLRELPRVTACFFGDGAANQGTFHESLNMAALWKLPIIYVCENNQFAMSTPVGQAMARCDLSARAEAYGMPGPSVDGNDLPAVEAAARRARRRAADGQGPTLLECRTYRLSGHSRGDPQHYKCPDQARAWARRDPIPRLRRLLRERGLLDAQADRAIRRQVGATLRDAVRFARRGPDPDPRTVGEGVYA